MYSGQAMIHTSGALGAEVLAPAMAAGTQIGAFHPLVAFADTERAVAALHGATVAIEGDDQLATMLAEMAERIGATPVRLAPGTKAAYHAAAVLAAGGFVALLDAIAELGRVAGLDEHGSLAIYGPLIEGTLGNARSLGIRAALTGPMTRGDVGTVRVAHRDAAPPRARRAGPVRRGGPARDRSGAGPGRPRTGGRDEDARRAQLGLASPARTGTIASHGPQHRGQVRGPTGGPIRPPVDPRARAPAGPAAVRLVPVARRSGPRSCAVRSSPPVARLRANWRVIQPAVSRRQRTGRLRPQVTMEWARSGRTGTVRRPGAASAPWPA